MEHINIDNLFLPNNKDKHEPLDVYSLFNTKENKTHSKINFSIEKLMKSNEKNKKKTLQQYQKIYNLCLNKIDMANIHKMTDIIYNVPKAVFRYPLYDPLECLNYIENNLRALYMDTLILSNSSIFISWANIKENKNKNKNININIDNQENNDMIKEIEKEKEEM